MSAGRKVSGHATANLSLLESWLTICRLCPAFAAMIVHGQGRRPAEAKSKAELLALLDANMETERIALASVSDDPVLTTVRVQADCSMPRIDILRTRLLSQMIQHRGQFSVYLRLLNLPVPGMYGPSADDGPPT